VIGVHRSRIVAEKDSVHEPATTSGVALHFPNLISIRVIGKVHILRAILPRAIMPEADVIAVFGINATVTTVARILVQVMAEPEGTPTITRSKVR
jgi:hypothetical protein